MDPVKLGIPDYFTIIKKPMDLGTIKTKLDREEYTYVNEFAADVRLVFVNSLTYLSCFFLFMFLLTLARFNSPGYDIYKMSEALLKQFNMKFESTTWERGTSNGDSYLIYFYSYNYLT